MRWMSLVIFVSLLCVSASLAQPQPGLPQPRLETLFPMGAQLGTSAELNLTGLDLDDAETLLFAHPGIKSEKIIPPPPAKADPKAPPPKGPPPLPKFKITVEGNVPLGQYDVRVINKYGVSNPRTFCIGNRKEAIEKEPNNDVPEAQKIELNSTINAILNNPTDVDYYSFTANKGQRILVHCASSSIESKAKPQVEIYDSTGKQLALNRNYQDQDALVDVTIPETGDYLVRVIVFTHVEGGPQHYYRLSIGDGPWIDAIYPCVLERNKPTQVTLYGRNLPGGAIDSSMQVDGKPVEKLSVTITPPNDPQADLKLSYANPLPPKMSSLDGFEYRFAASNGTSNPIFVGISKEPVVLENDENDKFETAQSVSIPCDISGRFERKFDRDWYSFDAKKGDVLWLDFLGDRLGTSSFFQLTIKNGSNKQDIADLEDVPESLSNNQFFTRNGDPVPFRFVAPADGKYAVRVACREGNFLFGPRVQYRLRITPENPDFRLIVMSSSDTIPEAATLRPNGQQMLDLFVWRKQGFNGPVQISAEGLPAGVTSPPQIIHAGVRQGTLVLSVAADAQPFVGHITIKGTATINGQPVVREARAATIVWGLQQQNIPSKTRLNDKLFVSIRDKAYFRFHLEMDKVFIKKEEKIQLPLVLKQGEKLTVPYKVDRLHPDVKQQINLQQVQLQQNMQQFPVTIQNAQPFQLPGDKSEGTFVVDVKQNAPPGNYMLVLRGQTQIPFNKDTMAKNKNNIQIFAPSLPLSLTVIPTTVAKLNLSGPNGNLKTGMNGEVLCKIERQNGYTGEFQVKIILPMNAKGIQADPLTIPAGQNEGKVILKVAQDAPASNIQNIVLQATAMYDGKYPLVQETKFNVNIEKTPEKK